MTRIKIAELRPVGFELFQDSETFLDELCDDWELDFVNSATKSHLISDAVDFKFFLLASIKKTDFLTSSIFNEDISSFSS